VLGSTTKREFQRRFQNWGRRWVQCGNSKGDSTDQYSENVWHCFTAPSYQFRLAPRTTLTSWLDVAGNDVQLGELSGTAHEPTTLNGSLLRLGDGENPLPSPTANDNCLSNAYFRLHSHVLQLRSKRPCGCRGSRRDFQSRLIALVGGWRWRPSLTGASLSEHIPRPWISSLSYCAYYYYYHYHLYGGYLQLCTWNKPCF